MYAEEDHLQLSGLQHFVFCRRQWALIHVEKQWAENLRTVEGSLFHTRAHDEKQRELRGDTLILRGLTVFSSSLGLSGQSGGRITVVCPGHVSGGNALLLHPGGFPFLWRDPATDPRSPE